MCAILAGVSTILGSAALGKAATPWLVCVFVPCIVVDLQLAIYCSAPGYNVCTYNTEEWPMIKKIAIRAYSFRQQFPGNKEIDPDLLGYDLCYPFLYHQKQRNVRVGIIWIVWYQMKMQINTNLYKSAHRKKTHESISFLWYKFIPTSIIQIYISQLILSSSLGNRTVAGSYRYNSWQI